jgi:O-antigen/teichoic acid export membrane protein
MAQFKSDSSVKRILKNGSYTALRFGVYSLSGIIFIPFLVRNYGEGTFGLIALAGFLTQYIGFISGCVGSAVSRYMNVALNRNDWQEANEIFSTALLANILLILFQLPLFAFAIWKLHWVVDVPPGLVGDFRILVICNACVFFMGLIKGIIFTPLYAANRLDILEQFDLWGQILRLILLVVLILFVGPYLWIIGVVELGIALLSGLVGFIFYKRLVRHQLIFRRRFINRKWIKPILNMAGWGIVANLGQIFFQKTDVWILNRFVNVELAGVCAALLLWPNFVQQIAKTITNVIMPAIIIDYAHERIERIRRAVLILSKFYTIVSLAVLGGAICLGSILLDVWMESYSRYHLFLVLMLIHFPLTLPREAMWSIFPAFDKMQYLGISNIVSGVLNVALSILAVMMGYGFIGVIIATGISLILQRALFITYFTTRLLEFERMQLFRIYIPGAVVMIFFFLDWAVLGNTYMVWIGVLSLGLSLVSALRMVLFDQNFRGLVDAVLKSVKNRR